MFHKRRHLLLCMLIRGRDSIVSIVTRLQAAQSKVQVLAEKGVYFSSKMSRLALGPTQPPIQLLLGFFSGGKAAGV
jgi:hypothetical protein